MVYCLDMEHVSEQIPARTDEMMNPSQLLSKAQREALPLERLEQIKDEQDVLTRSFLASELTLREYNARSKELDMYPGVLQTELVTTFRGLLEATGLSSDEVNEVLAHENAHMVEALCESLEGIYRLEFAKAETGGFSFYPAISVIFPDDMDDDVARTKLRNMIDAPDDLSPRDKSQLTNQGR